MPQHARSFRFRSMVTGTLLCALALLTLSAGSNPAFAEDEPAAEQERTRMKGPLGLVFASAPRAPKPWHQWGEFTMRGGLGPSFIGDHRESNDDGSLTGVDARSTGVGWSLGGGFMGKYVGAEVGWMDTGSAKFDATSDGSGDSWSAGDVSAEVEGSGWTLSGLVRIPIKPRWVMLARIGVLGWSTTETFTESSGGSTFTSHDENSGTSALLGVGFEYDIYSLDHFWLRTELTRAQVDDDELPILGVNGSLVFHY